MPLNKTTYKLAIVGATGLVGRKFIELLYERQFPIDQLYLLASQRSAQQAVKITLPDGQIKQVLCAEQFDWHKHAIDIALFSAGATVAKQLAPIVASTGCIVIDNSSAFRQNEDTPLIIPEINGDQLANIINHDHSIIANPNCSTIQMLMALYPIYQQVGIKKIIVATYQAASGAGSALMNALEQQEAPLTNNLIPQIDILESNGYSQEEMKMCRETQKILQDPDICISATAVRVPVLNSHSEAITIETAHAITAEHAIKLLQQQDPKQLVCLDQDWVDPKSVNGKDAVYVSRIRPALVFDQGLSLWVVADNLRKGAALNAVQIAELFVN